MHEKRRHFYLSLLVLYTKDTYILQYNYTYNDSVRRSNFGFFFSRAFVVGKEGEDKKYEDAAT